MYVLILALCFDLFCFLVPFGNLCINLYLILIPDLPVFIRTKKEFIGK